ncbi:unnamed protein product [Rotaria magnacalcarata]|uniref:Beta-1,4-galactosyltransferase n=1 Tax=Rotaria magnacalcarata TaxID=392030 RepID=A0A819QPI6_9BILA|nr:unnamed protein product [Rotaria magnacalcarata]CAF4034444.1 unnamed protein product [Rotaria magnacalcarata]
MLKNRRRIVLLFICFLIFIQAVYYVFTLRGKTIQVKIINSPTTSLNERKTDIEKLFAYVIKNSTIINNASASNESIRGVNSFAEGTFAISINFTKPDPVEYSSLPICNFSISNNDSSVYKVAINKTIYSLNVIEQHHGTDLHLGGHYFPKTCQAQQRLAIIVCYRNRLLHLKLFLDNIHPFLKQQKLDYTIFIVNQHGNEKFNRAALFNVGYIEAMKLYSFDCFIFHDVDLVPEDLRNLYRCGEQPRHMSVAVDKFNYRLLYSTLFGGVTAFSISDFVSANGYPTVYWGWGGEDDDMYQRVVRKLKKKIVRYPMEIARYKMIRSFNHTSSVVNPDRHAILYSKYNYDHDGINSMTYKLHGVTFYKLFTLVNVTLTEESFEQIRLRLNIKRREPRRLKPQKKKA